MTIAFDDTVDILHVVHDKALMKDMIAARSRLESSLKTSFRSKSVRALILVRSIFRVVRNLR